MRILPSLTALLFCFPGLAGTSSAAQQPSDDPAVLVHRAITENVLTTRGAPPFHAVLDIAPDPKGPETQRGRVELFWAAPEHYVLDINSPEFTQHLVVEGDRVSEADQGDYYPAWLHYFVLALFNPVDRAEEILAHPNAFQNQAVYADTCYEWDSRRNIVTEAERGADICFHKPLNELNYTRDYKRFLTMSDFQPFHDKTIARKYRAGLRVASLPSATLSVLEDWKPDASLPHVGISTSQRLTFHDQSAAEATASIVSQPQNVKWPITRQGALTGKVLVHVVTDRNGKVRESAAPSSDNEELKPFAAELARQYVFRPLLVNGQAVQAEMPLLISFHMDTQNPLHRLNDAETRAKVKGCTLPKTITDPASAGHMISIEMLLAADGHLAQIGSSDSKIGPPALFQQFGSCRFPAYLENGKPVSFRARFDVMAK